ncbi:MULTISPECIES: hypothetical protein [unclassified Streptomyces]|uniref:hypothetical protein n=1 Tax=unclassified Streptomyces TaxID=2593676 RepID=UPI0022B6D1D8|nr:MULTISPECIES: hypothetical protein [unclassified Streptomyces]MCZ7416180.1 hypothetical protein [Streptomyces sp. WMMC897]MCZ7434012.1 hypothetical protein [Streptomyces sp. WMMC1477]
MPLTILSADHELSAGAEISEEPLPYADRGRWRRPYRPGPWRVGSAAVLLLLAAYLLISAVVITLAGTLSGAAVCLGSAVALLLVALRVLRVGVWVSSHGVRQVSLTHTVTVKWPKIAAVRTVQQPVRWLGLPRTVQGQAVLIERRSGEPLRTLVTDRSGDFLGKPESFERAADVLEAWAADYGPGRRG